MAKSMRDKIREKAEDREKESSGGGFLKGDVEADFHEIKKGPDYFRIVPYEVTVDTNPEMPAGELWYQRTVWVHYDVGVEKKMVICNLKTIKKPCAVCEDRIKNERSGNMDEDELKALYPKERELFNILPDGEDLPILMTLSYHCFGKKLDEEIREGKEEWGDFAMLEGGYGLSVRWAEKSIGKSKNTFCEASRIDFEEEDDLPENILDDVYDLDAILNHLDYDTVKAMYYEGSDEGEQEESSSRSGRGGRSSGRGRGGSKDEEKDEKSSGRSGRRSSGRSGSGDEEKSSGRSGRSSGRGRSSNKDEGGGEGGDGTCPYGFEYATDCNKHDECDDCSEWKPCQKAQDAEKKGGSDSGGSKRGGRTSGRSSGKKEEKEEKPSGRSGRGGRSGRRSK